MRDIHDSSGGGAAYLGQGASYGAELLSPWAVLIAAALLAVNGAVSARFSLGLHRALALAASRCLSY
jgi:hypothetical protein